VVGGGNILNLVRVPGNPLKAALFLASKLLLLLLLLPQLLLLILLLLLLILLLLLLILLLLVLLVVQGLPDVFIFPILLQFAFLKKGGKTCSLFLSGSPCCCCWWCHPLKS